jgi:AraC-like DNA-binding protein
VITTVAAVRSGPDPVERDSRGILDPWLLRQRVRLTRYPAGPALHGLVDRFWAVQWDLPGDLVHRQEVLTHPGANFSVGFPDARSDAARTGAVEARLTGVARDLTTRELAGRGWAVAAMTTPGGLGAFLSGSAADLTDRVVPLGDAVEVDETDLLRRIGDAPDEAARVAVLAGALEAAVRPDRAEEARQVARVAEVAESDRSVRRLHDLAERSGIAPRTLQRLFARNAGVSPTWVLRRYRLLEAAEAVRQGQVVSWAQTAADLGYADQAHLNREFRAATGRTPAAYALAQSARTRTPSGAPGPSGSSTVPESGESGR